MKEILVVKNALVFLCSLTKQLIFFNKNRGDIFECLVGLCCSIFVYIDECIFLSNASFRKVVFNDIW